MVYPDGGALLDQPLLLLDAFATVADGVSRARKESDKGAG